MSLILPAATSTPLAVSRTSAPLTPMPTATSAIGSSCWWGAQPLRSSPPRCRRLQQCSTRLHWVFRRDLCPDLVPAPCLHPQSLKYRLPSSTFVVERHWWACQTASLTPSQPLTSLKRSWPG
ncbi:hypothetical protein PF008_g21795 [Phytophthora fragariae]|uniref:Uncharacterized protein n=1 Tax=Phytophthora fragariae TaxID=53985 RepID=A0A6G0QVI0_9STRA|nr:hypothetical protein PF008_g21795 [Phytophthora fragariae]